MRILVTGATGQVGSELVRSLAGLGEVVAPGRAEMDMSRPETVRAYLLAQRPDWIVNPAAYTAVDKAESEPELACAVNADSVAAIGEAARELGAAVVHFSTDYVFDGSGSRPYVETDATGPLGVYGASKLAGEQALAASGARHLTLRTSWVYGATGKNFLLTILRLAREKEQMKIVADQHGAPTWSRDLARLVAQVIAGGAEFEGGVYHAAGAGGTTWHGFAAEAVRLARLRWPEARFAEMLPIATSEYPTPAKRPGNSRLDCSKLAQGFGWEMMEWRASLAQVIAEI